MPMQMKTSPLRLSSYRKWLSSSTKGNQGTELTPYNPDPNKIKLSLSNKNWSNTRKTWKVNNRSKKRSPLSTALLETGMRNSRTSVNKDWVISRLSGNTSISSAREKCRSVTFAMEWQSFWEIVHTSTKTNWSKCSLTWTEIETHSLLLLTSKRWSLTATAGKPWPCATLKPSRVKKTIRLACRLLLPTGSMSMTSRANLLLSST